MKIFSLLLNIFQWFQRTCAVQQPGTRAERRNFYMRCLSTPLSWVIFEIFSFTVRDHGKIVFKKSLQVKNRGLIVKVGDNNHLRCYVIRNKRCFQYQSEMRLNFRVKSKNFSTSEFFCTNEFSKKTKKNSTLLSYLVELFNRANRAHKNFWVSR